MFKNYIFSLIGAFLVSITSVYAGDLGFRYIDGVCKNAEGNIGFNPYYIGQCADLSGVAMGNFSFDKLDMSGSKFLQSNLSRSSFRNTNLTGAQLQNATLIGAILENTNLQNANLESAQLSNATVIEVNFKNSIMKKIEAINTDFTYAQFDNVDLSEANFNGSDLSHAEIKNSKLLSAQFLKTNFNETTFSNVSADESNFSKSNLTNSKLKNFSGKNTNFHLAKLSGSIINDTSFVKATFKDAVVSNAELNQIDFQSSDLKGADFTDAKIGVIQLSNALFNKKTKFHLTKKQATDLGMVFISLYEFSGIKSGLDVNNLDGWEVCHKSLYTSLTFIQPILDACKGEFVMLACRKKDSETLTLAAYGPYEKVFKEDKSNDGVIANHVKFYFSSTMSMGFAPENAEINRDSCDFLDEESGQRLCFHTNSYSLTSGYRCGEILDISEYERLIFKTE